MPLSETEILRDVSERVVQQAIDTEFAKQGHSMTSAWQSSLVSKVEGENEVGIYATGYGMIVDAGVAPSRIPYGGAGTGGGQGISAYILGLVRFWKQRKPGISDKGALKLAFATAEVQKREGMSTEASVAFSSTGKRQHFMEELDWADIDSSVFMQLDSLISEESGEKATVYL